MSLRKPCVLILGLGANGLGVLRALHKMPGLEVVAVELGTREPGGFSRLGKKIKWQEAVDDASALHDKLNQWCPDKRETILFPTRDIEVNLLAELANILPENFLFYRNPYAVVEALGDKNKVRESAISAGLEIPKTLLLTDINDPTLASFQFPVLIKPLKQNASQTPFKNKIVYSLEELDQLLHTGDTMINRVVLQEFIPGGDDHVQHCNLLINNQAQTIGVIELQKIRQYLPLRGMTSYGKTLLTRELLPMSERLAAAVGYKGLMNVEFKKDSANNRWVFIETNLRLPIFNSVFPKSGINLAQLYVRSLLEEIDQPVFATAEATWMHEENDLANVLTHKVDIKFTHWFGQFIRTNSFAYWRLSDPLPSLYVWYRNIINGLKKIFANRFGNHSHDDNSSM